MREPEMSDCCCCSGSWWNNGFVVFLLAAHAAVSSSVNAVLPLGSVKSVHAATEVVRPGHSEAEVGFRGCLGPGRQHVHLSGAACRRLQLSAAPWSFFREDPNASAVTYDSHNRQICNNNTGSRVTDPTKAGYPADGTRSLRLKQMACGIAQTRFIFKTSDLPEYTDTSFSAAMQLRISCIKASFIDAITCENVLDATGNFPAISACRFLGKEAELTLLTRLQPNSRYSVTIKLILPDGRNSASENKFEFTTEFDQVKVIEGTMSPRDIIYTIPNAKDEAYYGNNNYQERGYITSFTWIPESQSYRPMPGVVTKFKFGIRTFGVMGLFGKVYVIDFVAHPTDVWRLGIPNNACDEYSATFVGTNCDYMSFSGAPASEANGFRIRIGSTPFNNLGSDQTFSLQIRNPITPVNMHWTATSFQLTSEGLPLEPFTVFLDKPISVLGAPTGSIVSYEMASISIEQWITLDFKPGNTVSPDGAATSGLIIIIPPSDFHVVDSSVPLAAPASEGHNALPCKSWSIDDMREGRWVCELGDNTVFRETVYRVLVRVINPGTSGAAKAWRIELWQQGATKPLAVTRSVRGMAITGRMAASVAPDNQLLGQDNLLRIDFTPTQDIGKVPRTRLKVRAPEGFLIIKRCLGFERVELPACECRGLDANGFDLIFEEADVIKAGTTYVFRIQTENPSVNVADDENMWLYETVRPDGIAIDSTRYTGFFLYPHMFAGLQVVPVSRRAGSQQVIVRFIPAQRMAIDDYARIRAPLGTTWDIANLEFTASSEATDANLLLVVDEVVDSSDPNVLRFKMGSAAEANIEYGVRAQYIVPQDTPVPNRWWIEHRRKTGNPAPKDWRYVASSGAPGFKTQALVNALLETYNLREEGWRNPTMVVFETTVPVEARTKNTAAGIVPVPAEVYLQAPLGFTYICPLTETVYMPPYTQNVPQNECEVHHETEADRNKLSLFFGSGLAAGVRYVFTIDLVNARVTDLANNDFSLATRIDGQVVESVTLPGFRLAKGMDDTKYVPVPSREDRRVEATANEVSFIIGTTFAIAADTTLEVKAPVGFRFNLDCTGDVKSASWISGVIALPTIEFCSNLERVSIELGNIAHITMKGRWEVANYGLAVKVSNPMFTPARNFWGLTIFDRQMVPQMTEAWVRGFSMQVVHDPVLVPYNNGNGVDGEASINRVEVSFNLTTRLEPHPTFHHSIVVRAADGFRFPSVCRDFTPNTQKPDRTPLPDETHCRGNGATELKLTLPVMRGLVNGTRYEFRFLVINPRETFDDTRNASRFWRIETRQADGSMVDLNRVVPAFPVYQRLGYFRVDTLSQAGLNSTVLRFHFMTTAPLPPQQTCTVYPPRGLRFQGLRDGACREEDPMILSRLFPEPLISGVTRLPEWVSCTVIGFDKVVLKNEEPILGGRPLVNGPVFEFFVKNGTNAESTPALNIFRIVANTETPLGREVWSADSWVIFPELGRTAVRGSNPAFGLYTNFTVTMQVVTQVPERGSIRVEAPPDTYFGPVIETLETRYDPLQSIPPQQGSLDARPVSGSVIICHVLRVPNWQCPLEFTPCIKMYYYEELKGIGLVLTGAQEAEFVTSKQNCLSMRTTCESGALSDLITCQSAGNEFVIQLQPRVVLPARRIFQFLVQGYNARKPNFAVELNKWHFATRNSDSEKTILDEKASIPGMTLLDPILVKGIVPQDTKVMTIENYVKITLVLAAPVDPRATLRMSYPMVFRRTASAAFQGVPVTTGGSFPRQVNRTISLNVIELVAIEETIPANEDLEIIVAMSNPELSPPRADNYWTFEASSTASGQKQILSAHYNASGFKIFGEFSLAHVTGTIYSPGKINVMAAWFVLKSELKQTSSSLMRIWMPKGYRPCPQCGAPNLVGSCGDEQLFKRSYNPNRKGVKNQFPPETRFQEIPSGTDCTDHYDPNSDMYYIQLELYAAGRLDYGLDYAFEFGVRNPMLDPPVGQNLWRFETMMRGVVLHLRRGIGGIILEQLKVARVTPAYTTSLLALNRLEISMMSDKAIQGGSQIKVVAPRGYTFTCAFFRTEVLSSTTTCYVAFTTPNLATFTVDSQDPKDPETPFKLLVTVSNPEFTPQENTWSFEMASPLGVVFDSRTGVQGFDITGRVQVEVRPGFPFLGERNPLDVVFVQDTIMNQAENGNELVLTAPEGWVFPANCTSRFKLRMTNERAQELAAPSAGQGASYDAFTFPPPGVTCIGYGNETVTVRMPDGAGLLKNNYTITVDVDNPGYVPNGTNLWTFETRVRPPGGGQRNVDANIEIPGFLLRELAPIVTDEGGAAPLLGFQSLALLTLVAHAIVSNQWGTDY